MSGHLSAPEREADSVLRPASKAPSRQAPPQPKNSHALLVAGTLLFSITFLGITCLDMTSGGRVLPLLTSVFWALVRWPALFLLPIVVGVVICAERRARR